METGFLGAAEGETIPFCYQNKAMRNAAPEVKIALEDMCAQAQMADFGALPASPKLDLC